MKKNTRKTPISKKVNIIIILIILLLFLTIGIPSFCMLLIKDNSDKIEYWDGTISSNYNSGSGSEEDPYIISSAKEFAYFQEQINSGNEYDGTYFQFTDNIYLNSGVIEYKENNIIYTKDSTKYYIKPFTNEYYDNREFTNLIGTINTFDSFNSFKGNIDGNDKFIYGLYITSNSITNLSLFDNFSGELNNLYFSNSLIYGNNSVGLINNSIDATYNNLIFNGDIYSNSIDNTSTYNIEDIEITELNNIINLDIEELPNGSQINSITLKGTLEGESIYINEKLVDTQEFEIQFDEIVSELVLSSESTGIKLTNLVYEIDYNYNISSIIINAKTTSINNSFIKGSITGKNITSGFIGNVIGEVEINDSFTDASIEGIHISSGLIGIINSSIVNINHFYNNGNINSENYAGGVIGYIYSESNINISNSFNTGTITGTYSGALIGSSSITIENDNNYYTNDNLNSIANSNIQIATFINIEELLLKSLLVDNLEFSENIWNITDRELPKLISFDNEKPNINLELLNYTWNDINNNEITINESAWLNVEYSDDKSDILKVEYHISNTLLNIDEIEELEFNLYEENIVLEENGQYYIIFKVTDVVGNINIATTDLITLEGYNLVISNIYNESLDNYNNQISTKSSIKFNFSRNYNMEIFKYDSNTKYMLESNILIPDDTIIKLIDNINNKIYNYIVDNTNTTNKNDKYLYDLSLFKEVGIITDIPFDNKVKNYYTDNSLSENFDFVLDFKNTEIDQNYEISINLIATYEDNIYSSTYTNLNNSFILVKYDDNNKETNYNFSISSDYTDYLDFSTISSYNINLVNNISYSKLNNKEIYDSEVNENSLYLLIKILDSNNNIVTGNLVNNISITYNNKIYYSNEFGYIKIPFDNKEINLTLDTNYLIKDVINGVYYLKISSCNELSRCSEEETIPINVSNKTSNVDCNFIVNIDDKDRLILRNVGQTLNNSSNINLSINYKGKLSNPNIRIKLYKKLNFDSNNQVYELIDLSQYISNNFELIDEYEYYLVKEINDNYSTSLNLLINNFQYGGYKLVFELYDGDSFVQENNKTFIVK